MNWCSCALLKCLNFFSFPFFFPLTKIESGLNSNLNKYTDLPNSLGSVNHIQFSSCSNSWNRMAVHTEIDAEFYQELPADETPFHSLPHRTYTITGACSTLLLSRIEAPLFSLPLFLNLFNTFVKIKRSVFWGKKSCWHFQVQHLDECTSACQGLRTCLGPLPSHTVVLV